MSVLTNNAKEILRDRYLLKDGFGNVVETLLQLFKRVAKFVATAKKKNKSKCRNKFYTLLKNFDFLPNSRTLMNAGPPKG